MAAGFPWYKGIDNYIINELEARRSVVKASKMMSWIVATSNLGEQKTIGTTSYANVVSGGKPSYNLDTESKFRPNPIISDFSVDFDKRGTIKMATLKIKCFNSKSLEEIQKYFLEPGISVFVQWGWNISAGSGRTISPLVANKENVNKYNRNPDELNSKRKMENGCYDNMVGLITGGSSNINGETYEVLVKLTSIGETLFAYTQNTLVKKIEAKIKNLEKEATLYESDKISEKEGDEILNWYYFYNQLPPECRRKKIKNLETRYKDRNFCQFINYNEDLLGTAQSETAAKWFGLKNNNLNFFGKNIAATDTESPITKNKYVSFYSFIDILNKTTLSGLQSNENSIMDLKIDISKTYIGSFNTIFSPDERIFIPNKECYNFLTNEPYYADAEGTAPSFLNNSIRIQNAIISFPKREDLNVSFGNENIKLVGGTYGWIGDIYLENSIVTEALKDLKTPIKDILDRVLGIMSDAVDNFWSFQIVEEGGKIRIADSNLRNSRGGINVHDFKLTGIDSIFLDAKFTLTLEQAYQSSIVLEKSTGCERSSPDKLIGLFSDKQDTILNKIPCETEEISNSTIAQTPQNKTAAWSDIKKNVKLLLQPIIRNGESITPTNVDFWAIPGIYLNKKLFTELRKAETNEGGAEAYIGHVLPVEFSFQTLGLGGFRVGHLFTVDGLPDQYSSKKKLGAFQIEEITHKIDDSKWTTEVSGHFRPFYKNS